MSLKNGDQLVYELIQKELNRQQNHLEMIASENFTSIDVMEAQGSILTNKYAEGLPGKRYYGGCEWVDQIEDLARERVKKLFNVEWANVQPHSGAQANAAVFLALLKPGDTVLSLDLSHGGHLSHGSKVNMSGKWFNIVHYQVDQNGVLNYNDILDIAKECKPQLIICGFSAYTRLIDFGKFRYIADEVGSYLLADIAHIAGLVASGVHPSPIPYADVVTTTTHKTLRGPRGGLIMSNDIELGKKLDKAVFPGTQGGPLEHVIAAKAVAFGEALKPEFELYCRQIVSNSRALAKRLIENDINIVSNGTDNHIVLLDLRSLGITGKFADQLVSEINITANKNTVPFDPESPFVTSGLRLGSSALTTRGFDENDFVEVADIISNRLKNYEQEGNKEECIKRVSKLCEKNPLY